MVMQNSMDRYCQLPYTLTVKGLTNWSLIAVPPSIDRSAVPDQLTVIQNSTIAIDCPVSGVPPPSIIWFKDEVGLFVDACMRACVRACVRVCVCMCV